MENLLLILPGPLTGIAFYIFLTVWAKKEAPWRAISLYWALVMVYWFARGVS